MSNSSSSSNGETVLRVGLAQMVPHWMDRAVTLEKVCQYIREATAHDCQLVAFGEATVPGYPFWLDRTGGAEFNSSKQKQQFAQYAGQAVCIEAGHLDDVCRLAADGGIAVVLGIVERPRDRGGHSLYCSLVYISADGTIGSVHRKLMPTYEERLVWSPGDGHGLRVHPLGQFTVGGLNCWENWMPLARAALYAQGEDLHVAIWPGSERNTEDITRFIAKESRSFVISVSSMMSAEDVPSEHPLASELQQPHDAIWADGGSCIAAPDGSWVVAPLLGSEGLTVAELDHRQVLEERHNFDPVGHYSRPDVTKLQVDRTRQNTVEFVERGQ